VEWKTMSENLSRVSPRKIAANRQNALKSTGPKTPQGKAYSRSNALKHGLFAMNLFIGAPAKGESAEQYRGLLDRLTEDYQPVGAAEHLEVERIAACWWKLGRAWRYENSQIRYQQAGVEERMQSLIGPNSPERASALSVEHAILDLLRRARLDIQFTGKISDELKRKMASDWRFQSMWTHIQRATEMQVVGLAGQVSGDNRSAPTDRDDRTKFLLQNIELGIEMQQRRTKELVDDIGTCPYDNVAIPEPGELDRLLRAEAAAEKSLTRAIDRLERLQRRRSGEAVPPPVNVRLTR
jgi:hypothetical protein